MRQGRPRVLVLGADPLREAALATWRALGYGVTLCDAASAQLAPLATSYLPVEVRDHLGDVEEIAVAAGRHDAVVTLSDGSQRLAASVAERWGLPHSGVKAAALARSKLAQRALGLSGSPMVKAVGSPGDIDAFFAEHDGCAVLKPVAGTGSTAVYRVENAAEAKSLYSRVRAFSPDGQVLIESYIDGPEVSLEAVVRAGSPEWVSVTAKRLGGPTGHIETGHRVGGDASTARFGHALTELLEAWEVENAVVHAEFRLPRDGKPVLIEAAVRPAGGMICDITVMVTAVNLYEMHVALALGSALPGPSAPAPACRFAGIEHVLGTGKVRRQVEAHEIVAGTATVRLARQVAQPGRELRAVHGGWARVGHVIAGGDDRDSVDRELVAACALMRREMGLAVPA